MQLSVSHHGSIVSADFFTEPDLPIRELRRRVAALLSVPEETMRILVRGKMLKSEEHDAQSVADIGMCEGDTLYVMASSVEEVAAVKGAVPDPLVRPFGRVVPRYVAEPRRTGGIRGFGEDYGFGRVEELPGFADRAKARAMLLAFANDPGILKVMAAKKWRVGALKEMRPDGKVGVDPVCVLGLNENKGETILLRLRTDDLQGFRAEASLKQVLCHELAHNEISEHDNSFKELMRQIERDSRKANWTQSEGHVAGYSEPYQRNSERVVGEDPLASDGMGAKVSTLHISRRLGSGSLDLQPVGVSRLLTQESDHMQRLPQPALDSDVKVDELLQAETIRPTSSTSEPDREAGPEKRRRPIDELLAMGFSRGLSTVALRETSGDAARAADWLLSPEVRSSPESDLANPELENDSSARRLSNLRDALQTLRQKHSPQKQLLVSILDALHLYVGNLLRQPARFSRINNANSAFQSRVGQFPSAVSVLSCSGFTLDNGFWTVPSVDLGHVWVAKTLIQDMLLNELA